MESTRAMPHKERSNGVFALALGYSRCKDYLVKTANPKKELSETLTSSLREFAGMATDEARFDEKLGEVRKRLDRFEAMLEGT